MVIWYSFPRFGMLYPEKSGNPARKAAHKLSSVPSFAQRTTFSSSAIRGVNVLGIEILDLHRTSMLAQVLQNIFWGKTTL
jgi:hypothetical protein